MDTCIYCYNTKDIFFICLACKEFRCCNQCYDKYVKDRTTCLKCDNKLINYITERKLLTKRLEREVIERYIQYEMRVIKEKTKELEAHLHTLTTITDEIAIRNAAEIIERQQKTIRGRIKYEVEREVENILDFVYYSSGIDAKLVEVMKNIVDNLSQMLSVENIVFDMKEITRRMEIEYVYGYPYNVVAKMELDLENGEYVNVNLFCSMLINVGDKYDYYYPKLPYTYQLNEKYIKDMKNRYFLSLVTTFCRWYDNCKHNKWSVHGNSSHIDYHNPRFKRGNEGWCSSILDDYRVTCSDRGRIMGDSKKLKELRKSIDDKKLEVYLSIIKNVEDKSINKDYDGMRIYIDKCIQEMCREIFYMHEKVLKEFFDSAFEHVSNGTPAGFIKLKTEWE
jgi:hypothetical protein